jgi:hypothetical protein
MRISNNINTSLSRILERALPKISLDNVGMRTQDISLLEEYIKTIPNVDLISERSKLAKTRQREVLVGGRLFRRSGAFAAVEDEIYRRNKLGIAIHEVPIRVVTYRRTLPKNCTT